MPAISAPNATIIRYPSTGIQNLYFNIYPLGTPIATADMSTLPTYPEGDYTVTNTSAGWLDGKESMVVRIYDSTETTLKYEGILRQNNQASTLRIAGRQDGDTGIALEEAQDFAVGDKIKVYDVRVPRSQLSRVDGATQYKRWSVTYVAQNSTPNPQPNIGSHRHAVASSGSATFTMDMSNSYSWNGNSLTYAWFPPSGTPPTGITISSGVYTDASIDIDVDTGNYQLEALCEDSVTTQSKRGYRYIFVTDGVGGSNPSFSDSYGVQIESDFQDRVGREVSVRVVVPNGTDLSDYLYSGAPCLLTYEHMFSDDYYATTSQPTAGMVESFTGYLKAYERVTTNSDGYDEYSLQFQSILKFLDNAPIALQFVEENAAPSSWQEVSTSLNHLAYWYYYIMEYHAPSITQITDFDYGDLNGYQRESFKINAGNILDALLDSTKYVAGSNIGCRSDGAILARRNANYENDAYRTSLATVWTFADDDILGEVTYNRNYFMQYGLCDGSGIVYGASGGSDKYVGRAASEAQQQATQRATMPAFIGLSQNDVLDKIGHHLAYVNRPTASIDVRLRSGLDFVDPALMEGYDFNLSSKYDVLGTGIVTGSYQHLANSVTREWSYENGNVTKAISASFEPTTKGARAQLLDASVIGDKLEVRRYRHDFTVSDGGFTNFTVGEGTWTNGVGWESTTVTTTEQLSITLSISGTKITKARAYFSSASPSDIGGFGLALYDSGATRLADDNTINDLGTGVGTLTVKNVSGSTAEIRVDVFNTSGVAYTLTKIEYWVRGQNNISGGAYF